MVPPRAIRSARSVAGRPGPGVQRARIDGLEEQRHRLLHGGDGVAGGAVVAVQGAAQQPVPERRRVRVGAQDLLGLVGVAGVGDPLQHVLERCGRSGRRRGSRPAAPWRPRRRRSGPRRRRASGDRALDGAGGERLGPPLGDHRVGAAGDRVPHQLRQPRAPGRTGRAPRPAGCRLARGVEGEQQVVGLGQRHQRRARRVQQRRGQQVEGLARALRPVDAGRSGRRAPTAPRLAGPPRTRAATPPGPGRTAKGAACPGRRDVGADDGLMHRTVRTGLPPAGWSAGRS